MPIEESLQRIINPTIYDKNDFVAKLKERYLVFQCLVHTTDLNKVQKRIFSACHDKRNLAEYEGHYETDEQRLTELITNTKTLLKYVNRIKL